MTTKSTLVAPATPALLARLSSAGLIGASVHDERARLVSAVTAVRESIGELQTLVNAIARRCDDLVGDRHLGAVLSVVSQEFGVSSRSIVGKSKMQSVVRARHAAIDLYRRVSGASIRETQIAFGGIEHTTVTHAVVRSSNLFAMDRHFRSRWERCAAILIVNQPPTTNHPPASNA